MAPYKVKVLVCNLNIRRGPGTNCPVVGGIYDEGIYTIVAESPGQGASLWGKLKSGAGWISLDYTQRLTPTPPFPPFPPFPPCPPCPPCPPYPPCPTRPPYLVKVTTWNLNIRQGPGTNYPIVGGIYDQGIYTIVAESPGPGASLWGKLKSGAGWISLDYTIRV